MLKRLLTKKPSLLLKFFDYHLSGVKREQRRAQEILYETLSELEEELKTRKESSVRPIDAKLVKKSVSYSWWNVRAFFRVIVKFFDLTQLFFRPPSPKALGEREQIILKHVRMGIPLEGDFSAKEIFQTVFLDQDCADQLEEYESELKVPQIESTLVIVSGVFNELFATPAFERACKHLKKEYGINYLTLKVSGQKSPRYNARLIHRQLKYYMKKHPNEKLWIVPYSKGGLDTLYYLRQMGQRLSKNIQGVSLIASPILGSGHLDHKIVRLFRFFQNNSLSIVNRDWHRFFADFQDSLSVHYQRPWFRRNRKLLSSKIFYTALAFQGDWFDRHLGMSFAKFFFQSEHPNDGIVDVTCAQFPEDFPATNLGVVKAHHWVSSQSSFFNQEALFRSLVITLHYLGLLK